MTKTLLMIGGGELQLPVLRWAKEAGLRVVLTDRRPEAPGRELADEFRPLAGDDLAGQVELATELAARGPFAGAYCGNDFGLAAVAAVAAATGTPGPTPEAVRASLDKARSTGLWRAAGLSTTEGRTVGDAAEAEAARRDLGGDVIVKPTDSSGSRGVSTVRAAEETPAAFEEARRFSDTVVVERRVEGLHLDVNGFFRDGAFVPAGLLERHFDPRGTNVPVYGTQPAGLTGAEAGRIYRLVEEGARQLGIDTGPVKADLVLGAEGPVMYELAPRFHGDVSTSHVSPLVYGKSPVQAWFAHLAEAGGPFDEMPLVPLAVGGWAALLADETGELEAVEGRERARRLPGIEQVFTRRPGFQVVSTEDNRAVCGFVWARGRSREEVEARLERAKETLEVRMTWQRVA